MKNKQYYPASGGAALALALLIAGASAVGAAARADANTLPPAGAGGDAVAAAASAELKARWGVEPLSLRPTVHGQMLDFRYKVLDAEKAAPLFDRRSKARLVHQDSGKTLVVPMTARVGYLRSTQKPQEGKVYWMFFGNPGAFVEPGDKVTVVIGEFQAPDLVVQ